MPDPISQEDKLKKIFVDPKQAARVAEYLVADKPAGWCRKANAPYYNITYAEQLKEVVDQMMIDRLDVCYSYDDYLKHYGISKDTLYLRINQSKRFLLERMDQDKVYARFFDTVQINRERGVGVTINFIPEFRNGPSDFKPRPIEPREEKYKWQKDMDEWLEQSNPGDEPFFKGNLALRPDQISALKMQLAPLRNVLTSITAHSVKLVKVNIETA